VRLAPLAIGIALAANVGAAPRAGKVVRVERRPHGLTGTPRYCTVSTVDLVGYCITAKPPEIGDRMTVIDSQRVLGVIRITQVQPLGDGCQQGLVWMTQGLLDSGDLQSPQGQMIGVVDVPLDARSAKLVAVDKTPTGHPWGTDMIYAIDGNSDGSVDLEFVQFQCDDAGAQSINATSSCYEVWATMPGRGLEKLRGERLRNCY